MTTSLCWFRRRFHSHCLEWVQWFDVWNNHWNIFLEDVKSVQENDLNRRFFLECDELRHAKCRVVLKVLCMLWNLVLKQAKVNKLQIKFENILGDVFLDFVGSRITQTLHSFALTVCIDFRVLFKDNQIHWPSLPLNERKNRVARQKLFPIRLGAHLADNFLLAHAVDTQRKFYPSLFSSETWFFVFK